MQLLGTFRLCYLLGAVNAGFFSCLIFSKRNKTKADYILAGWLIILSAQLFIPFLYLADINKYYQYAGIEILFYVFHPFLLHLYVKTIIGNSPGKHFLAWNTLIITVSESFNLFFFRYPAKERLLLIEGKIFLPFPYILLAVLFIGYMTYNIYSSYKLLKHYKNNVLKVYSYRENVDLLWLRRLIVLFTGISILIFPMGVVSYYILHSIILTDYFFFIALVLFIFYIGYWGYQQGQVFNFNNSIDMNDTDDNGPQPPAVENNTIMQRRYRKEAAQLLHLMKSKKPFLEPTLTIHDLARMADMPPHQLSKVINKEFQCNFFEFINSYRIEEFKQRAFTDEYRNLTILGIALECGFNSKSAFNRIFKDITGFTPGDFIKNHRP